MSDASETMSERVYNTLYDEITSGSLGPETHLVRRDIARRLGVSTIPVTEALLRLEQDGLVESKPNCGSRVRPLTSERLLNECMLREALECQVARLVTERASSREIAGLESAAVRLDRQMERIEPGARIGMELHMEFHLRLADCAGFSLMTEQLRSVWVRHLMQLNWLNAALCPPPKNWHQLLISAVQSGDPDRAEARAREHVRYGQKTLEEAMQRLGADKNGYSGQTWGVDN